MRVEVSDGERGQLFKYLLSHSVNTWPDFVPALIAYADFAYNSSIERTEDEHTLALRQAGIKTIDMEKYPDTTYIESIELINPTITLISCADYN